MAGLLKYTWLTNVATDQSVVCALSADTFYSFPLENIYVGYTLSPMPLTIIAERRTKREENRERYWRNWLCEHEQVKFFWVSLSIKREKFPGLRKDQMR